MFRKEEIKILVVSSMLVLVLVAVMSILSMCLEMCISLDFFWAFLGLFLGIIGAVSTTVYIRHSRLKQFLLKYDIVGTYYKVDATGKVETHDYGNREVIIESYDGLSFKMHSQYIHRDGKIRIALSTLTFNDDLSGLGQGSYRYENIEDSGIYEVIAHANKGEVTISVKFQNLYPNINAIGTYLIKKQNGNIDKINLYMHAV